MLNAQQKFKATPVGEIPVDWECVRLGHIIDSLTSGVSLTCGDQTPEPDEPSILKLSCVSGGIFNPNERKKAPREIWDKLKIYARKDSILISRSNTPSLVGTCAFVDQNYTNLFLPDTIWRLEDSKKNRSCQKWLALLLGSNRFKNRLSQIASGTSNSMKKLQKPSLLKLRIPLPPLPEQQKIADILGTWDSAIDTQQKLIIALTQRKKALAQQLLTGKSRLPGFEEPWEMAQLGGLFQRVTKKNTDGHTQVVTISAQQGLVCQQDYFNKQIASTLLDNYYVLGRGQFAYNKSYSKGYPMGAIKRLNRYDHGVVTTLYICFAIRSPQSTSSDFWEHYFESGSLNRGITRIAHEGGRAHGLLNVTPKDFFELNIHRPTLPEQIAIAKVLTTADRELALHTQNLTTLQTQKRALMQQLLTGKVRVTI